MTMSVTARAFSLIELVMVVVVLGVIGAIAVPRLSGFGERAKVSAAAANVSIVKSRIEEYIAVEGVPPTAISGDWFAGKRVPKNPFATTGDPRQVQAVSGGVGVTEPSIKTIEGRVSYWYNRDNGEFRARVATKGSAEATLAVYNTVNGTSLADANATAKDTEAETGFEIGG
jgi:prepilin-type N-terminal cleavage/methylation domain-containing protein